MYKSESARTTDSRKVDEMCTKFGQLMDNDTDESRKHGILYTMDCYGLLHGRHCLWNRLLFHHE